jgi:hypothetical protein
MFGVLVSGGNVDLQALRAASCRVSTRTTPITRPGMRCGATNDAGPPIE